VTGSLNNNTEYARLRKQFNDLNAEYIRGGATDDEMKGRLAALSSDMKKLDMQRNSSTGSVQSTTSVDDMIQKKIQMEGLLMATTQKISSLQSAIGQLNGGISGMATKSAVIQQLDKEIEMASADYKDATDRYNLALNLGGATPGNFKQTMVGEPAQRPLPNKKMMTMALVGICAFIISSLVIIGIEFFDQSVKTPSQFQRLTDLPLLGTINSVKLHNNNILDHVTLFNGKENRDNIFRELIRKLRYEIESSNKKIFLFTSTEPNQGKTMLIQSIAYSLSLSKKRVLIIDTNFCNNDLTKATSASPVLEKFSLNGKPFDLESIKSFITKTPAEGVDVIGCEGGDYTPSEILPKNHLLNYLELLKEEYDYIFMEGAPLNIFTDTKELVKYAEGLIAIFSADATYTAADKESIGFLFDNKEKFLGAILNKVQEDNLNL
jgi:Mrp family chromosome partitioning ATPase